MAANTLRQAVTAGAGDVIGQPWSDVDNATGSRIREFFPSPEAARYAASRQAERSLTAVVAPLTWPHAAGLALGLLLALYALRRCIRRGDVRSLALVLLVLAGVAANAFATGGLSKPHHRYQARIAWLIPVVAIVALLPAPVPRRGRAQQDVSARA
jgi:hypothetical protein